MKEKSGEYPPSRSDGVIQIGPENLKSEALAADGIIRLECKEDKTRRRFKELTKGLITIMQSGNGALPDSPYIEDAKIVDRASRVVAGFNKAAGRTSFSPPAEYGGSVSDEVANAFSHGIIISVDEKEPISATLDDYLAHLSQIFSMNRKASYDYVTREGGLFDEALEHVSRKSVDYEKFLGAMKTGRYILSKVEQSPANQIGAISVYIRNAGISDDEIDKFYEEQFQAAAYLRSGGLYEDKGGQISLDI